MRFFKSQLNKSLLAYSNCKGQEESACTKCPGMHSTAKANQSQLAHSKCQGKQMSVSGLGTARAGKDQLAYQSSSVDDLFEGFRLFLCPLFLFALIECFQLFPSHLAITIHISAIEEVIQHL